MIEIKDVSVKFDTPNGVVTAVDDVSIDISEGEIFGVIGYSGAGKSTLVRTINMLQPPTQGSVTVNGMNMTELSEKKLHAALKNIGMVFQHFNLLAQRTVAENIAFPLKGSGHSKQEVEEKIDRLLELVDLSDRKDAYPSQLSGGQKQRVGIARALANDPKVLLCDEATSALDPDTTFQILDLLKDVNQQLGITIVVITHEMAVIKNICDRVAIMSEGRVVESGSVFDIFTQPQHEVTQRFIESASQTEKDVNFILDDLLSGPDADNLRLVRVDYAGRDKGDKLVERLIQEFQLSPRILFANIEMLQGQPAGTLLLDLQGDLAQVEAAEEMMAGHELRVKNYHQLSSKQTLGGDQ